jgi:hypothetical protein
VVEVAVAPVGGRQLAKRENLFTNHAFVDVYELINRGNQCRKGLLVHIYGPGVVIVVLVLVMMVLMVMVT